MVGMSTVYEPTAKPERSTLRAIWRGARMRCPKCGKGKLFRKYLKVADVCPHCAEELHHHRADDAPAYLTIFLVGHLIIPPILLLEVWYQPPYWLQFTVWLPVLAALTLGLLPVVKGAVVGLQWALKMHGFETAPGACKPLDTER